MLVPSKISYITVEAACPPRYPYQANEDQVIIEVDSLERVSLGCETNEDRDDGDNQAQPNKYFQERAQVVFGDSNSSHDDQHNRVRYT